MTLSWPVLLVGLVGIIQPVSGVEPNAKLDGYRGIWFSIGQVDPVWGPKYSGGLGTYTAKHRPIASYSEKVDKTFFVYGGVDKASGDLLIMASCYDHAKDTVPRPTVVHHKKKVNDPHDDASILIDPAGTVWVFISGRGRGRPGLLYRSTAPYSVDEFEHIRTAEFTYPQPWYLAADGNGRGPVIFHMFTKYTAGRELYWGTSPDGVKWSEDRKLAGFGGHYQASAEWRGKIVTAFNYHIKGPDTRTNLYYLQTTDRGKTWTTADGTPVAVPLKSPENPALLHNYRDEGRLVYVKDMNFDARGNPLMLYVTGGGWRAGPDNDPRLWHLARWTGSEWVYTLVSRSDHNYDMGSLYVEGDTLRVIAPTETGPQPYHTGGEVAVWTSRDLGRTWKKQRQVTSDSPRNHTYVRRPTNAHDPFYAFWADGDPSKRGRSDLYFCNAAGDRVRRLPVKMTTDAAQPETMK